MIAPIDGLQIQVDRFLEGSKYAVQFGNGPVLVSPAMMELLRGAENEAELKLLLSNIHIKHLPALPHIGMFTTMPLTTRPQSW